MQERAHPPPADATPIDATIKPGRTAQHPHVGAGRSRKLDIGRAAGATPARSRAVRGTRRSLYTRGFWPLPALWLV